MKIIQISQRQIHCAFSFAISPSSRYQKPVLWRNILSISWQNRVYRMARETKCDVEQVLPGGYGGAFAIWK